MSPALFFFRLTQLSNRCSLSLTDVSRRKRSEDDDNDDDSDEDNDEDNDDDNDSDSDSNDDDDNDSDSDGKKYELSASVAQNSSRLLNSGAISKWLLHNYMHGHTLFND